MQAVRKNAKEYKKAISNAKNIMVYRLESDFHAAPVKCLLPVDIELGKLVKGNGNYRLRVHSNLWYEWAA